MVVQYSDIDSGQERPRTSKVVVQVFHGDIVPILRERVDDQQCSSECEELESHPLSLGYHRLHSCTLTSPIFLVSLTFSSLLGHAFAIEMLLLRSCY
ncbi:hypothetical protein SLA2020_465960 [Shorea laevis]